MATIEKKYLGTAGVQALVTFVKNQDALNLQAANSYADGLAGNYDAAGTAETKVQELANGQVKTNTEHIGTMDNLETTAKGDLVNAINEVRNAVSAGGTAAAITMEEKNSELGEGVAKAYVLKQGDNTVGTINIPKDMVVQSGEVVVDPEGQEAGTYIKLTLANATNDIIYVNVGTLVDIYKAKASATQIQIAIDSASREISASIVAGSVTATELAADAVTTVKIADGNVTKAKLATDVQASLDKADGAAADATAKANAAQAAAEAAAKAYAQELYEDIVNELGGRIELVENPVTEARIEDGAVTYDKVSDHLQNVADIAHEHSNKDQLDSYDKTQTELLASAQTAAETYINDALAYHDEEYSILSNVVGDVKGRVEALESVTYVEMTDADIQQIIASLN